MAQQQAVTLPSEPTSSGYGSATVASLVAMADFCLAQDPQQIKEAIQCLLAALSLTPPPRVEARVKLQLGLTLYHHSNNLLEARQTLEQAMLLSKSIPGIEQIRFEAASVLGRIHIEQGYAHNAKKVIKSAMETSYRSPYWHCRLLLQKADIHVYEKDTESLISTLTQAVEYADQVNAPYTKILCLLSKGAHLLIQKQYQEAAVILKSSCSLVEEYQGPRATLLKTFFMVIQVTHLLGAGLMKAAKPHLKHLQQCVKLLSSEAPCPQSKELTAESFEWFSKEQTYILVYLVCTMHSVLVGHTEKALSFARKALDVLARKKDSSPVMIVFEAHLLELIISSTLMQGHYTKAGQKLQEAVDICHSHSQLIYSHRSVLHTLLGVYAFATNNDDRSVAQFQTALQHTNSLELKVFINVNLAVAYMRIGSSKEKELAALIESLQSENVNSLSCKNLKGAVMFIKGLNAFHQVKLHEAKRHLRETLSLSNSNDLNKLSVCALLTLGQIFLSVGGTKETKDMIDTAFTLCCRISDKRLQAWAASLLIDLHHMTGERESEQTSMESLSAIQADLTKECQTSVMSSHHSLIQWTIGDWPVSKQREEELFDNDDQMECDTTFVDGLQQNTTILAGHTKNSHVTAHTDHVTAHINHVTQKDHVTAHTDHVTARTDHVTSHTDHVTAHTDHVTRRADRVTQIDHVTPHADHRSIRTDHMTPRHADHVTPHTNQVTAHTGHVTAHTDHVTPHTDHVTPHTDHVTAHIDHVTSHRKSTHMLKDHLTSPIHQRPSHMTHHSDHMTSQAQPGHAPLHVSPHLTPPGPGHVTSQVHHMTEQIDHAQPPKDHLHSFTHAKESSKRRKMSSTLSSNVPIDPLIGRTDSHLPLGHHKSFSGGSSSERETNSHSKQSPHSLSHIASPLVQSTTPIHLTPPQTTPRYPITHLSQSNPSPQHSLTPPLSSSSQTLLYSNQQSPYSQSPHQQYHQKFNPSPLTRLQSPPLKHMGTLPSAEAVATQSPLYRHKSPDSAAASGSLPVHQRDAGAIHRSSPGLPAQPQLRPFNEQTQLSSLVHQRQEMLMSPAYRHHQHQPQPQQQQQQQHYSDRLHQYGYSALSPEAILRQKEHPPQQSLQHLQLPQMVPLNFNRVQQPTMMPAGHHSIGVPPQLQLHYNPTGMMPHPMAGYYQQQQQYQRVVPSSLHALQFQQQQQMMAPGSSSRAGHQLNPSGHPPPH